MNYFKNRNRYTNFKNKLMVTKGETWRGGISQEFGINKLLELIQTTNKGLLYNTKYYIQHLGINRTGKIFLKDCICAYNGVTLLYNRN